MPVTLLPGRFRLATNPIATGSAASVVTIGMVEVAAFTATAARQHCPGAAGAAIDVRFTLMKRRKSGHHERSGACHQRKSHGALMVGGVQRGGARGRMALTAAGGTEVSSSSRRRPSMAWRASSIARRIDSSPVACPAPRCTAQAGSQA